jgi:hypothetical protein
MLLLFALLVAIAVGPIANARPAAQTNPSGPVEGTGGVAVVTREYAPTDEDFANPERGFYRQYTPFWTGTTRRPLSSQSLAKVRQERISLVRAYFVIDEFRDAPLSREALQSIAADLDAVRQAGLKIIPRFAYNFPTIRTYREAVDAPIDRVKRHIDQLRPILRGNADVIAFMEVGFVGAWGEWHSSSNGLLQPDRSLNSKSSTIITRLLKTLPKSRMLALRYPFLKEQLFGSRPLSPARAFTGTPQARVGAHNDCFASGESNGGTYSTPRAMTRTMAALKGYLSDDNRFVVQGGESCGSDVASVRSDPYARCSSALADLSMMRWSTMNLEYHPEVIKLWQEEGCLEEIRRRLGYRFRLVDGAISPTVPRGGRFSLRVTVANDGWAAPYNRRLVEIVLRHRTTGRLFKDRVKVDPRRWGPGATHIVAFERSLPRSVSAGDYDVLINLPDPEPRLNGRPEYSIRFANVGTWEPLSGFNDLRLTVTVVN